MPVIEQDKTGGARDAWTILGIEKGATVEAIRAAYLRQVAAHPPDRDSTEFEKIRDAYTFLKDPKKRFLDTVILEPALTKFADLLPPSSWRRKHVPFDVWVSLLKDRRG